MKTALERFNEWFMNNDIPPQHMDACWQGYVEGSWEQDPIENECGPDTRAREAATNAE